MNMQAAYMWYDDLEEDEYPEYSKSVATRRASSNPADVAAFIGKEEGQMSAIDVGYTFTTGNSTVAELPVGSVLRVSGDGELEIVEVAEVEETHEPGDFFESKYGAATVVKMTSQFGKVRDIVSGAKAGFLYIADDTNIVRGQLL
jgi:hypothetical protein